MDTESIKVNIYELPHEKTNNLHRQKQRSRSASRLFALTAKMISAFVLATRIVQSLFLNLKFQAVFCGCTAGFMSDLFSHEAAHMSKKIIMPLAVSEVLIG